MTPAEWRIFSLIAKQGPLTVRQLVEELAEIDAQVVRGYTTILTLAQRLAAKGYLVQLPKAAARGRASVVTYTTSVPYDDALRTHTERFLAQYVGDPDDLRRVREQIDQHLVKR